MPKPEQVGLSSEPLNKITATLRADVDKGVIPGAVLLVARHGKVVWFDWGGAGGTYFWVDPKEDLFVVFHDAVAQAACALSLPAQRDGLCGGHQARKVRPAPQLDAARPN